MRFKLEANPNHFKFGTRVGANATVIKHDLFFNLQNFDTKTKAKMNKNAIFGAERLQNPKPRTMLHICITYFTKAFQDSMT